MKNRDKTSMKVSSAVNQDELKVIKRKFIVMLAAMGVLAAAILVFRSTAWFTSNKDVLGDGIQMTASSMPFSIEMTGSEGVYKNQFGKTGSEAQIWLVNETHNLDNNSELDEKELGIEPGDSGVLQFRIIPKANEASLNLTFWLTAWSEDGETGDLTELTDPDLLGYLSTHVMIFEHKDASGKLYGLIDSNEQLKRVLKNKKFYKSDSTYTQIYWVWPEYLSNLSKEDENLIYQLDADKSEKSKVINYIVAHKTAFFRNLPDDVTDEILRDDLMNENYTVYSKFYDKADIEIGRRVDYIILSMSAKETSGT